jgi:hypothetical protein
MLVPKEEGPIEKFSGAGLCLFITNVVVCAFGMPYYTIRWEQLTALD